MLFGNQRLKPEAHTVFGSCTPNSNLQDKVTACFNFIHFERMVMAGSHGKLEEHPVEFDGYDIEVHRQVITQFV